MGNKIEIGMSKQLPILNDYNEYKFRPFSFESCNTHSNQTNKCFPKARSGHRIACDENNLYSFGGFDPQQIANTSEIESAPLFKELWRYNLSTKEWQNLEINGDVPIELASNAMLLNGCVLLIFGGTGYPFGSKSSSDLYLCHLQDNFKFMCVETDGQKPPGAYGQAVALIDHHFYVIGGTDGFNFSCNIHSLDLKNKVWENVYTSCSNLKKIEPPGRYRHETVFSGESLYIFGGGTMTEVHGFSEIPCFNIKEREWKMVQTSGDSYFSPPSYPDPRRCHGCVYVPQDSAQNEAVFIIGGYDGTTVFNDVWKLELRTMHWFRVQTCCLPKPLYFHSAAITPSGCAYVFGGVSERNKRTADIYRAWLTIPKLSEICWDAVLHYSMYNSVLSKEYLHFNGLPQKFFRRLGNS